MEKIDLNRARQLNRILAGKEKRQDRTQSILASMKGKPGFRADSITADPGLEDRRDLFTYRSKYHLFVNKVYHKLTEAEAKKQIADNPETKLYYICTSQGMCPMPSAFTGKGAKAVILKSDTEVIAYINGITGGTLKKSQL